MRYDYDWNTDEDAEHCYIIFEIDGAKVVAYADSKDEALTLIAELELEEV